jgi:hypothetical protein
MSPSQLDLDQGGTFRQYQRVFMGPSVGWLYVPQQAILPITATGTYAISRGTNLITIAANGNVTINLPSSKAATAGPQSIPGQWYLALVTIADVGGFAGTNTYTINPIAGETISGLTTIRLATPYGAFLLKPILETGGWTLLQ